jgi:VWFA-related protein
MRRVLAGSACVLAAATSAAPGAQSPLFRANTDLVPVYVSVRAGNGTVGALQSSDFTVTDRGVAQTVEVASSDAVPIDVTLVVDTSRSVINSLPLFRAEVQTIVGQLQPNEQIRLITFDTEVRQILAMQPPSERPPVQQIQLGDTTSLADALVIALARARRPDRRHLVFAFTDGYDTSSILGYGALPELASHTDSIVHIALVKPSGSDLPSVGAIGALAAAATRTGGSLYPPSENVGGLVAAFQRAIDDFRHSYVLFFTPTGVPGPGWHDISVKVLKQGDFDVRAREGYFGK